MTAQSVYLYVTGVSKGNQEITENALEQLTIEMDQMQALVEWSLRINTDRESHSLMEFLSFESDLDLALLLDENGKVMAAQHARLIGNTLFSPNISEVLGWPPAQLQDRIKKQTTKLNGDLLSHSSGHKILGLYPVHLSGKTKGLRLSRIGTLLIQKDISQTRLALLKKRKLDLFDSAIFLILSVSLIGVLLHFLITAKVKRLLFAVDRLAVGDFSVRSHQKGYGEIGRLGVAFDSMAANLEEMRREVKYQKEYSQILLDSTAESIFGVDLDARCTFVNQACLNELGYDDEKQLLGVHLHQFHAHWDDNSHPYPEENCPRCRKICSEAHLLREKSSFAAKNGKQLPVEFSAAPMKQDGVLVGTVISFVNIHQQLELERGKDEFISTVSHELRTPLTAIFGAVKILK